LRRFGWRLSAAQVYLVAQELALLAQVLLVQAQD
jgi:hypothetical protein